jgi:two-component system sensor histidine kinase DesK
VNVHALSGLGPREGDRSGRGRSRWVAVIALAAVVPVVATLEHGLAWILVYAWGLVVAPRLPHERALLVLLAATSIGLALLRLRSGTDDLIHALMHSAFPALCYRFLGQYSRDAATIEREAELAKRQLEHAADREARLRLAGEIHDGLGATLTGAVLNGEVATRALAGDHERAIRSLQRMRALLQEGGAELARLSTASTGAPTRWSDVEAEVRRFAVAVLEPRGVRLEVDATVGGDHELTPQVYAELTAAVRELLTNVARHAEAREARVVARIGDGYLHVAVEDDGLGTSGAVPGFGWSGLERRIDAMGGELERAAPRGGGTRILLRIPAESA